MPNPNPNPNPNEEEEDDGIAGELSEAVARAVELSAAARVKGAAQGQAKAAAAHVQAAWRGAQERRRSCTTWLAEGSRSRRDTGASTEPGRGHAADQAGPADEDGATVTL